MEEAFGEVTAETLQQYFPGVAALACTPSDPSAYEIILGDTSLDPGNAYPLTQDSIFALASCTKLLTSIAALQCVERGLVTIDTPVCDVLPEFGDRQILKGFDDSGKPLLVELPCQVLLRHLLTHTSGLAYEQIHPIMTKWFTSQGIDGEKLRGKHAKLYGVPLLDAPGTAWHYGQGLDWVGLMVCRLTGKRRLGEYIQENIFRPLRIFNAGFRREDFRISEAELEQRLVRSTTRNADGNLEAGQQVPPNLSDIVEDNGGGGVYMSPKQFLQVLHSLLANDSRLLGAANVYKWCFTPNIDEQAQSSLLQEFALPHWGSLMKGGLLLRNALHPDDVYEFSHSFIGGLCRRKDCHEWQAMWCGFPNTYWFIDHVNEVGGIWSTMLHPLGDKIALEWYSKWRFATIGRLAQK